MLFGWQDSSKRNDYGSILEHFGNRENPYPGFDIPEDQVLVEIKDLIKADKLQEASDLLAQIYDIKGCKIVSNDERYQDSFLTYDFANGEIVLYIVNLPSSLERLWALLLGFFEHLSAMKSWRFHDDPEVSHSKQREEAETFAKRILDRYVAMGILAKKE